MRDHLETTTRGAPRTRESLSCQIRVIRSFVRRDAWFLPATYGDMPYVDRALTRLERSRLLADSYVGLLGQCLKGRESRDKCSPVAGIEARQKARK